MQKGLRMRYHDMVTRGEAKDHSHSYTQKVPWTAAQTAALQKLAPAYVGRAKCWKLLLQQHGHEFGDNMTAVRSDRASPLP